MPTVKIKNMETKIKSASVKVMLSYNYNHFESSMVVENENGLSMQEIDDARKNCQRLCDKAITQYQKAKDFENKRVNQEYEKRSLEREVAAILNKPDNERTITEKAKVKALQDHEWEEKWNYEDDEHEDYGF